MGNRLTSTTATGDWTYNANNQLLSYPSASGSPASAGYDANGNTIQKNVNGQIQNYVYDADNRLIEVKDASNNTIAKYTYDPFGRRVKKELGSASPANAGGITYYLYSDEGLIGEYDSTGAEIKTYGYKPSSTWSTDPVFCHSNEGGNPGYYFYHNDHLGTPQKMTNLSGAIVWQATYDAFGKATVDAASSITNNLRFPGQYFDAETGWHQNLNRYYDPVTGRYVTEDPIGLESGDVNYYRYVRNNPLVFIDETGLSGWGDFVRSFGDGVPLSVDPGPNNYCANRQSGSCRWTGSVTIKTYGGKKGYAGGTALMALKSDCCNCKKAQGTYMATFGGASLSPKAMPIQVFTTMLEFSGPGTPSHLDPVGVFSTLSLGGGFGSISTMKTGYISTDFGPSPEAGNDVGIDAYIGISYKFIGGKTTDCKGK
ncbi:MAG: RHS repeat-associated core domain-containing protein [Smithella sp.]